MKMTAEEFRRIRDKLPEELAGTDEKLGRTLGRTRPMINAYAKGRQEIPHIVAVCMRLLGQAAEDNHQAITDITSQVQQ